VHITARARAGPCSRGIEEREFTPATRSAGEGTNLTRDSLWSFRENIIVDRIYSLAAAVNNM
jgi:hypothetical protein